MHFKYTLIYIHGNIMPLDQIKPIQYLHIPDSTEIEFLFQEYRILFQEV